MLCSGAARDRAAQGGRERETREVAAWVGILEDFHLGRSVQGFSKGGDGTGRSGSNWCDASLLMDVTHRLHSGHSGSMSVKGCPQRQEQCCCLHEKLRRKEREKKFIQRGQRYGSKRTARRCKD